MRCVVINQVRLRWYGVAHILQAVGKRLQLRRKIGTWLAAETVLEREVAADRITGSLELVSDV